jgi:hypothetical protein
MIPAIYCTGAIMPEKFQCDYIYEHGPLRGKPCGAEKVQFHYLAGLYLCRCAPHRNWGWPSPISMEEYLVGMIMNS